VSASRARLGRRLLDVWLFLAVVVVTAPLVVVVIISLSKNAYISMPKHGVTLHWWREALVDPTFRSAALVSLVIAVLSVVGALALGVPAAYGLNRARGGASQATRLVLSGPLIIPEILTALGLLSLLSYYNIGNGYTRLFLGHLVITLPYVVQLVSAAFARTDVRQEWAAKTLGASALRTFFVVVLPQIASEVTAAALFVFIVSWNNAGLSIFLSGPNATTLPATIFTDLQFNASPSVIAACAELVLLSVVVATLLKKYFAFDSVLTRQFSR
jgi:putative spermidine/putrescine transport system permease protein